MRRRGFITFLGGAAAAWPLAGTAQQSVPPLVAYLNLRSEQSDTPFVAAFRRGLGEQGLVESTNVRIEYRWADNIHCAYHPWRQISSVGNRRCWLSAAAP
jgi:putative ABC transport system substrate-binding protein